MTPIDIERVYDALATALDSLTDDKRDLFLAKIALLLAHELGDADRICDLIAQAACVGPE
ncbi:hypothetical protein [Thalassovita taeanensis]|uniref:DUF2783 domain-containing protein n=1 Tax=Thalassovita taeanensis TaxID=657014 RepID=A0A1H9BEY2_9RHOB|nr:hypothetical protein [Thalassovita taeanensis]SEP87193.1 hypothetical protein SAMN04488092_102476 [Thalassovita taeanensis]